MMRWWTVGCLALLASCGGSGGAGAPAQTGEGQVLVDPKTWELSADEKAWVETRKTGGGLRVASTELEGAFLSTPTGPVGFHADLARGLGEFLGLPVQFRSVTFDTYFSRDGSVPAEVKTDPSVSYVPDVYRDSDVAAFNFNNLPWRQKLMEFHPVFPTRVVLVTLRGHEIRQLSELTHRKVVVFANTSHEQYMRQLKDNLGLDFTLLSVPFETDLFALVRQGGADAMVRDANGVMMLLQKSTDFNVTLPVMPSEWSHWAVSKQNPLLGSMVEKYLIKARATGELSALWLRSYGLSLEAYQNLIGDDPAPVWTDEEQRVIARLGKTGLRVAIDQEQTIYEPQADGTAKGITYNLVLEVAKRLGVPLKLRTVPFGQYFERGGKFPDQVKTDANFTYRPDLLDQVDLYADTFSPLEWRKRFLSFVSLYPSKLVWVVRKDQSGGPAPGRKVAVLAESSYQDWIKKSATVRPEDLVLTQSGDEAVRMVVDGKAALTVTDANLGLGWLAKYPQITFFPADGEVQDLSWAISRDEPALAALLSKTLEALRRSGTFSAIWQAYYGVPLDEYLGLLATDTSS